MDSLKELYKIGRGPSSSHTIGPERIAQYALHRYGRQKYKVILYGSLAMTGRGHGTDRVLRAVLGEDTKICFDTKEKNLPHANTMKVFLSQEGKDTLLFTAQSVGGGSVLINGEDPFSTGNPYPEKNFEEIKAFVTARRITLKDYVTHYEPALFPFLRTVWHAMEESVQHGLAANGVLPGGLHLERKAKTLFAEDARFETAIMRENRLVSAFSLAVAEENAAGGVIVTAPTCGSAGILPGVLYYMRHEQNVAEEEIIDALAVAGVIGNVVKTNASISGAACGCQAEVGVACAMAAAALAQIYALDTEGIECSAEIALEHNLGLTCDPVLGLVQIPCIERNAMAGIKAFNAVMLAKSLEAKHKISFDEIVAVMYETGKDLKAGYRETSAGGLAKLYRFFLSPSGKTEA